MDINWTPSDAWTAPYQEALQEIANERKDIIYATENKVDLDRCADEEDWIPGEHILELVTNFSEITVIALEDLPSLNVAHNKLRSTKVIGLVLMGQTVNRRSQPAAIVLVTPDTFYVIPPNYVKGVQFLKAKLEDSELTFWTTNGINEADCLYHIYNIDLTRTRARVICCSGVHMHLMDLLKARPCTTYSRYPVCAVERSRGDILVESYEKLVQFWLDLYPEEYHYEREQLEHLSKRPLSRTAVNVIKKRCVCVIPLFTTLDHFSWFEVKEMSRNVYDTLNTEDENTRLRIIRAIAESKAQGVVEDSTFAQLNGSC